MHIVSPLVPSRRMPSEQTRATLTHMEALLGAGWRKPRFCGVCDFPFPGKARGLSNAEDGVTLQPTPRASLHLLAQDRVHVSLVLLAMRAEPRQHIGVHAQADLLLQRPVKSSHMNVPWERFHGRVCE